MQSVLTIDCMNTRSLFVAAAGALVAAAMLACAFAGSQIVPAADGRAADLSMMLSYSDSLVRGETPYIGWNLYPPMASVLYVPLLAVPLAAAWLIASAATVGASVTATMALPVASTSRQRAVVVGMAMLSLVSYPMLFELERGQFNVIAWTAGLFGVWLFHKNPALRWLAYASLTLGIQLKLYPAILIVMLAGDGMRPWLRRVAVLGAANVALLFVLGQGVFAEFLQAVAAQADNPGIWRANHSIRAFTVMLADYASRHGVASFSPRMVELPMLAAAVAAMLATWRSGAWKPTAATLLSAALFACLFSPVSHDCKLTILFAPLAWYLAVAVESESPSRASAALLAVVVAAVAWMMLPDAAKPLLLANNCPTLVVAISAVASRAAIERPRAIAT